MKIVFPFLYGTHQLYHSAMTAMELTLQDKNLDVLCVSCNKEHTEILNEIKEKYPETRTEIVELKQPFRYKYLNYKKKKYPSVNAMVKKGKRFFKEADIVVTTSHGTIKMFKKYGIVSPKFIYQYHGSGGREYSFDLELSKYDMIFVTGEFTKNGLIKKKISHENKVKIVGYPKFDFPIDKDKIKKKLFKKDLPIVLYSPHWEPELSSYKKYAKDVLEYFSKQEKYNLIFAPHLLVSHWKNRFGYNIDFQDYSSDNIVVDFGSKFSTNGTYLSISDMYIGDVSSMVYEFIARKPKPCIFFNAHGIEWQNNPDYKFWNFGTVFNTFSEFKENFKSAINDKKTLEFQKENIKKYIEITDEKSSVRAAKEILKFANNVF